MAAIYKQGTSASVRTGAEFSEALQVKTQPQHTSRARATAAAKSVGPAGGAEEASAGGAAGASASGADVGGSSAMVEGRECSVQVAGWTQTRRARSCLFLCVERTKAGGEYGYNVRLRTPRPPLEDSAPSQQRTISEKNASNQGRSMYSGTQRTSGVAEVQLLLIGKSNKLWHGGQGRLSRPFLKTAARVANGSVHVHVHSVCWFRMHTPKYMYSTCNVSQSTTYSYTGIHLYIYSCPWIHPVGVRGGAGATTRRSGWSRGSKRTREAPHSTG